MLPCLQKIHRVTRLQDTERWGLMFVRLCTLFVLESDSSVIAVNSSHLHLSMSNARHLYLL